MRNENVKGAPLRRSFGYRFLACHQKLPGLLIPETPGREIQAGESRASPWPRRWPGCAHHPECHRCARSPASAIMHRGGLLLVGALWESLLHCPTISGWTCFSKQFLLCFAWLPATGVAERRHVQISREHWRYEEEPWLKSTVTDQLQPPWLSM